MNITLYMLPGSHPCIAARLMLKHKGLTASEVELIPAVHRLFLKLRGFPGRTVPALAIDGEKLVGSCNLSRRLDQLVPEPPLFPADLAHRQRVEEAEKWGDEILQGVPRRLSWWALHRNPKLARSFVDQSRLPVPKFVAMRLVPILAVRAVRLRDATDTRVRADLTELPGHLDRVDRWIEEGTMGGEALNAADFQVGVSLRLLMTFEDLRPVLEERPAGQLALRVAADYPGGFSSVVPPEWLPSR